MGTKPIKCAVLSALAGVVALGLAACAGLPGADGLIGGTGGVNYAEGAALAPSLSGRDRAALGAAFVAAMDAGEMRQWRGERAVGVVMPGGYALGNLYGDPSRLVSAARGDFDLAHRMETELGDHVLTRNSNIRTGPGTDNQITEVLPSGSGVEVVGRVVDRNWMLIAMDGAVRGYVFGDLVIEAPGSELALAGGPVRRPVLCRRFTQRVNIYSDREEWRGAACNDGTGWRLVAGPAML